MMSYSMKAAQRSRRHTPPRRGYDPYGRPFKPSGSPPPHPTCPNPPTNPRKYDGLVRCESGLMCVLCNQRPFRHYTSALRHVTGESHRHQLRNYMKTAPNTIPHLPKGLEAIPFKSFLLCTKCNCKVDLDVVGHHIFSRRHLNGPVLVTRLSTFEFKCELCNERLVGYRTVMDHLSNNHQRRKAGLDPPGVRASDGAVSRVARAVYPECKIGLGVPLPPFVAGNDEEEDGEVRDTGDEDSGRLSMGDGCEPRDVDGSHQCALDLRVKKREASGFEEAAMDPISAEACGNFQEGNASLGKDAVPAIVDNPIQNIVKDEGILDAPAPHPSIKREAQEDCDDDVIILECFPTKLAAGGKPADSSGGTATPSASEESGVIDTESIPTKIYVNPKYQLSQQFAQSKQLEVTSRAMTCAELPRGIKKMSDDKCLLCFCCRCVFLVDDMYEHVMSISHREKLKQRVIKSVHGFSCDTCALTLTGPASAVQHLRGKRHCKNQISTYKPLPIGVTQLGDEEFWGCSFCRCVFPSHAVIQHISGISHQKALKEGGNATHKYFCDICCSEVATNHVRDHLQGKTHRENVTSMVWRLRAQTLLKGDDPAGRV